MLEAVDLNLSLTIALGVFLGLMPLLTIFFAFVLHRSWWRDKEDTESNGIAMTLTLCFSGIFLLALGHWITGLSG